MVKMDNQDINDFAVYAFRYCLGRQSYAIYTINQLIRKYLKHLSNETLNLFLKEITNAINDDNIGMNIDKQEWLQTFDIIKVELNKRK